MFRIRRFAFADGDKRKRCFHQVIGHDARRAGGAFDCAPEGHDEVIFAVIQRILQVAFLYGNKCSSIACLLSGIAHKIDSDANYVVRI